MTIIAPSVLSADFAKLGQQIEELNNSSAEWIHYDVMDGHFVPNLTFGPDILKTINNLTTKVIDVHIMVSNPMDTVDYFKNCKIDYITFHQEAVDDNSLIPLINKIHNLGIKVGISIKPNTPPEKLLGILEKVELVLVMSVEPGFGGQKFISNSLDKLDWLNDYRNEHNLNYLLEIDGGINEETAKLAKEHHCDVLVAGSYIFKHVDGIKEAVETIR